MRPVLAAAWATCALAAAAPADAEVIDASPAGMTTHGVARVAATPAQAWAVLVTPARYWNAEHSWSGDAANMTLDPRAGGCFCEALPKQGGSVRHMQVIFARPDDELRMSGALGPFQTEAVTGVLTVTLKPIAGGTEIAWDYKLGGYTRLNLVELAPVVDGVVGEQLGRLADLLGRLSGPQG
jgi:hypothetical protein